MDAVIGKVLDTLDEIGAGKNTLVVFASDNGGTASARPCGLRGIKGTTFEGGIRVPCLARWPGVLPAGMECAEPAATFDLTFSFACAAGVKPPRPFDGVDVLGAIVRGERLPPRALFWRGRRGERTWRAVRDGALKYVSQADGAWVEEFLFDIARDGAEEKNLAAERASEVARLKAKLTAWEAEVRPQR
jgi:N-acetylgalactosamine-6-sulfatase